MSAGSEDYKLYCEEHKVFPDAGKWKVFYLHPTEEDRIERGAESAPMKCGVCKCQADWMLVRVDVE